MFCPCGFSHSGIMITPLGGEIACLCTFRAFVCVAHVDLCFVFLLVSVVLCDCGTPWTLLFTFMLHHKCRKQKEHRNCPWSSE